MEDRIILIATLRLLDNQLDGLKETVQALQAHCAETEKGMLQYDWYISASKDTIKVLETYENSKAVLLHFDNYKPFAPRLDEFRSFVSLEVYGPASAALLKRVEKINAEHFTTVSYLNKLNK